MIHCPNLNSHGQESNYSQFFFSHLKPMPKAKKFTAHKAHNQPYSTNPETARIREIEQSRVGLTAEVARISTKYHTHLTRRKVSLHKTLKWKQLSEEEQVQ